MADGFARLTNKPQAVIVHVDVGTQALGPGIHNASCGRVPVLIFAGLSPYTLEGEMRGSRTEFIHWLQDVPDQKAIVSQYCVGVLGAIFSFLTSMHFQDTSWEYLAPTLTGSWKY